MSAPIVTCRYWTRGDKLTGGFCSIGDEAKHAADKEFPRTAPSFKECDRCKHYDGPKRIGDRIEGFVKPLARALAPDCLDEQERVRPDSPCGKRKGIANKIERAVRQVLS